MGYESQSTKFKDVKLPRIRVAAQMADPAALAPAQDKAIAALQADLALVKRALAKVQEKLRDRTVAASAAAEADHRVLQRLLTDVYAETGITPACIIGRQRISGFMAAARLMFCARAQQAGFTHRQIGAFMNGRSATAVSSFLHRARDAEGA